jgi:hypothetical protein
VNSYKEEFDVKVQNECLETGVSSGETDASLQPHSPECVGRPAELPPVKLTDLLTEEPDNTEQDEAVNPTPSHPHRPECVGRPAGLPPIKLTDLLTEEPDNAESAEIDTGAAVGNEVW